MRRSERQGTGVRKPLLRVGELLSQLAAVSVFLTAFVTYAGYSYYDALFRNFGLRHTIFELGPVDFSVIGFNAILASTLKVFADNWLFWLRQFAVGLILIAGLVFLSRRYAWPRQVVEMIDARAGTLRRFGTIGFAVALLCVAALSGSQFGAIDARHIRSAAVNFPLCYRSAHTIHRGRVIDQGPTITAIKTASATVLLATSDIAEVADCN